MSPFYGINYKPKTNKNNNITNYFLELVPPTGENKFKTRVPFKFPTITLSISCVISPSMLGEINQ